MRPHVTALCAVLTVAALAALGPQASAQPAAPAAPNPAKIEEAKTHMVAGAAFYNDPSGHKCEEAVREFSKAYELSGSLNALKGMALCNLELEHDGEAIEQYTKFLQGKGSSIDPAEKQQVESDLNALKAAVAFVTFNTDHPGVRLSDVRTPSKGYPITNRYALPMTGKKLSLHPGQHVITASADGVPDQTWSVEITNGGKYDHTFEFDKGKPVVAEGFGNKDLPGGDEADPKKTRSSRPVPPAAIAFGVITLAGAGATAGLGVRALGLNSTYTEANGKQSASALTTLKDEVKTANLITDIVLGVTLASAVTTVVIFAVRPTKKVAPKAAGWTVAPAVGQTGGGAVVSGSF